MYTDCKDPNCVKCKQASKGLSSAEENRSKIPKTVEQNSEEASLVKEIVANDLLSAAVARRDCLTSSRKLKEEVHVQINELISVLRERELDLCIEIEREQSAQAQKIDFNLTLDCVDRVMNIYDENKRPPSNTALVFNSDFEDLKRRLKCFGQFKYEDTKAHTGANKKAFSIGSSVLPSFEVDPQTTYKAKNTAPLCSTSPFTLASLAKSTIRNEETRKEEVKKLKALRQEMNRLDDDDDDDDDELDIEKCLKMKIEIERQLAKAELIMEKADFERDVESVLEVLTPQNFNSLLFKLKCFNIDTEEKLALLVDLIYEKAVKEPNDSVLYAKLCKHLSLIKVPINGMSGTHVNFRKLILTKCQKEFEEGRREIKTSEAADPEKRKKTLSEYLDEKIIRYRKLGNIRFIGELFNLGMLIEPIINECIQELKSQCDEESSECLCLLLKTVGKELDNGMAIKTSRDSLEKERKLPPTFEAQEIRKERLNIRQKIKSLDDINYEFGRFWKMETGMQLTPTQEIMQKKVGSILENFGKRERAERRKLREEDEKYCREAEEVFQRLRQVLKSRRKFEPERLSTQIRKRFGKLATRATECQKAEEIACPLVAASSFESVAPNQEAGKDNASEKNLQLWAKSPVSDLKKDKTSETDLKDDKIASPSCEDVDSLYNKDVETDSSWDEDDIEIITRMEADSILSDCSPSPPLPPKNRFKFGGRRLASIFKKKGDTKPLDSPSSSEKSEGCDLGKGGSHASLSCAVSSCGHTEVKENPSSIWQPDQKSSECLGDSKVECRDYDPTVALRSSFTKYLEKNPESEWLAHGKTSEQSLPSGKSSKERVVPILDQELDQWLPTESNQKKASDWLYLARM